MRGAGYACGMTVDIDTALAWRGRTVHDRDGEKLGKLGALYLDADDRPAYGGVQTGLFGRHESVIPLRDAQAVDDEGLRVPFTKADLEAAPRLDPDTALTEEEEEALHAHYGAATGDREAPGERSPATGAAGGDQEAPGEPSRATGAAAGDDAAPGESPATTGAAPELVRSEEQVRVRPGGEMKPAERVRLRKVLVTEHVKTTVPRRKEVVQLETEPAPEGRIEAVQDVPPDRP
jgi:hypothetical protein